MFAYDMSLITFSHQTNNLRLSPSLFLPASAQEYIEISQSVKNLFGVVNRKFLISLPVRFYSTCYFLFFINTDFLVFHVGILLFAECVRV